MVTLQSCKTSSAAGAFSAQPCSVPPPLPAMLTFSPHFLLHQEQALIDFLSLFGFFFLLMDWPLNVIQATGSETLKSLGSTCLKCRFLDSTPRDHNFLDLEDPHFRQAPPTSASNVDVCNSIFRNSQFNQPFQFLFSLKQFFFSYS